MSEDSKVLAANRKAPWTKPDMQRIAAADAESAGAGSADAVVFS